MRLGVATVWLLGCSYAPSSGVETDGPQPSDAPLEDGPPADAPLDSRVTASCDLIPNGLVACYQLDDTLTNGSTTFVDSEGNHDAPATGFLPTIRDVPANSAAVMVTPSSSAKAPESPAWALAGNFTVTAWIKPINPNSNENEGIVDHEAAWAMSIDHGELTCWSNRNSGLFTVAMSTFDSNAWQLVACRVNGNDGCITKIGADGAIAQACGMANANGTAGKNGISIGSFQDDGGGAVEQFNGAIDDLRIYARGLSNGELCTLAGHSTCTTRDEQ